MKKNEIGNKIKELRRRKDMTQNDMANHLNVANSTISNWEHGRRLPSIEELRKIAHLFQVSFDVFQMYEQFPDKENAQNSTRDKVQIIDHKPLGIPIKRNELILFIVSTVLISISIFMPFLFVFVIYFVGFFLIAYVFGKILMRKHEYGSIAYKRLQLPVNSDVYYVHQSDASKTGKTTKRFKYTLLIMLTISFAMVINLLIMVYVWDHPIFNMGVSLFALVYILSHLQVYKSLIHKKVISKHVPYYRAHFRLRYVSLYVLWVLNSILLISFYLLVAIQIELFSIGIMVSFVGLLISINTILSFGLVVYYNRFIHQFTLCTCMNPDDCRPLVL